MWVEKHQGFGIRKSFPASFLHACFSRVRRALVLVLLIGLAVILSAGISQALASEQVHLSNPAALPSTSLKTIIVENYYPYTFVNDKGFPDGFSVDVAKAVVETMDGTLEIGVDSWAHATNSLTNGTIELVSRIMPKIEKFLVISDRTATGLAK